MNYKKYLAELIGTFILVFCATGAAIINYESKGLVSHLGCAATCGLIVLSMIYAIGDVSGAHMNPAVSLSFAIAGEMKWKEVPMYFVAQLIGAVMASGVLRILFPAHETLGITLPAGAEMQTFVLELILSFILMFVILFVATGSKEKGIMAGIAIGSIVGLEVLFAGPISGGSMNPIRSLAPALVSGHLEHVWIYLTAPFVGMIIAVGGFKVIRTK